MVFIESQNVVVYCSTNSRIAWINVKTLKKIGSINL